MCLVAEGSVLSIAGCNEGDAAQSFTLEGDHTAVWRPETDTTEPSYTAGDGPTGTDETDAYDYTHIPSTGDSAVKASQTGSKNDALESKCGHHRGQRPGEAAAISVAIAMAVFIL